MILLRGEPIDTRVRAVKIVVVAPRGDQMARMTEVGVLRIQLMHCRLGAAGLPMLLSFPIAQHESPQFKETDVGASSPSPGRVDGPGGTYGDGQCRAAASVHNDRYQGLGQKWLSPFSFRKAIYMRGVGVQVGDLAIRHRRWRHNGSFSIFAILT